MEISEAATLWLKTLNNANIIEHNVNGDRAYSLTNSKDIINVHINTSSNITDHIHTHTPCCAD